MPQVFKGQSLDQAGGGGPQVAMVGKIHLVLRWQTPLDPACNLNQGCSGESSVSGVPATGQIQRLRKSTELGY